MEYKHPVKFGSLSVEDGLSQSSVLCIFQDSKGFMWFGTEDGLNRYDGYGFKIYRPEPNNPKTISNNIILALYEDSQKRLWIGTDGGGLNRMIPGERENSPPSFIHYQANPNKPDTFGLTNVMAINEDHQGTLWIGTQNGLYEFDREKNQFIHYQTVPNNHNSLSNNAVNAICEDHLGVLWIGTYTGGLNKLEPIDHEDENNKKFLRGVARKAPSAGRKANNTIGAVRKAPSAMRHAPILFHVYTLQK